MGWIAIARIKIIIHQHIDNIQFFMEEKPQELHRSFFNLKCNLHNLYLRNPQTERNALYLPVRSPHCVWHFSKSRKTTHLTMNRNMKTWTRGSIVIPPQIGLKTEEVGGTGGNWMTRSFMIRTYCQISFGWLTLKELSRRGMWHVRGQEKCI